MSNNHHFVIASGPTVTQTQMSKKTKYLLELNSTFHSSFFTFHFFNSKIPSSSCGTNGPSLHSKMTLPDSSDSNLCHTPFGMFTPYTPSSAHSTTLPITEGTYFASQYNERLILSEMPMDWGLCSRFNGIQHTMTFLIEVVMKVVIHSQTMRVLRPPRQFVH